MKEENERESKEAWALAFKNRHECSRCPFVKNEADVDVGVMYDCDYVCAMETSDILNYMLMW